MTLPRVFADDCPAHDSLPGFRRTSQKSEVNLARIGSFQLYQGSYHQSHQLDSGVQVRQHVTTKGPSSVSLTLQPGLIPPSNTLVFIEISHSTVPPAGTIETSINYHREPEPGEHVPVPYLNTAGSRRVKHEPHTVKVTDIRTVDNIFTVDNNGFQVVEYTGPKGINYETFSNDESIKTEVYGEVEDLIKKFTGATRVYVINHIIRRKPHQVALDCPKELDDMDTYSVQTPAMGAHVDQSYRGADYLIENLYHDKADEIRAAAKRCRFGIINLWKPLKTVTREPLGICDGKSVSDSADLRPYTMRIRAQDSPGKKEKEIELWPVKYNPEHRWYWLSRMEPNEAWLIKCFDSKKEGVVRRAPHSAFHLPNDESSPPRESIEVRCVVFWEDQAKEE